MRPDFDKSSAQLFKENQRKIKYFESVEIVSFDDAQFILNKTVLDNKNKLCRMNLKINSICTKKWKQQKLIQNIINQQERESWF